MQHMETHEESNMHTYVRTHSYTAICKIRFCVPCCSLACVAAATAAKPGNVLVVCHPPRQSRDSSGVGILNWGKPNCSGPEY